MADTIDIGKGAAKDRPAREERTPRTKPPGDDATSRRRERDKGAASDATPRPRRKGTKPTADERIKESLTGMYAMIGSGMSGIGAVQQNAGLYAAGVNVAMQAEGIADNWLDAANEIPAVRRGLESMLKGGAVTVLVMSHVGLILPALAAAGVVPQQVGNMFLAPEAVEQGMAFQAQQAAAAAAQNGTPVQ